jgi:hypothetical protein
MPSKSLGPEPQMTSHETACILNVSNQDAHADYGSVIGCAG